MSFIKGAGQFLKKAAPVIGGFLGGPGTSIALGAMSAYGQHRTNQANRAMAREQMQFQQEMSSTSWQRGVKDLEAAGLNPALAYAQGGASSPGGATATMGDPLNTGISSAQSARALKQQMQLARDQTHATVRNLNAQADKTATEGANALIEGDLLRQHQRENDRRFEFEVEMMPFQKALLTAQGLLTGNQAAAEGLRLPGLRNQARFSEWIGPAGAAIPAIASSASAAASLLPLFRGANLGVAARAGAAKAGMRAGQIPTLLRKNSPINPSRNR